MNPHDFTQKNRLGINRGGLFCIEIRYNIYLLNNLHLQPTVDRSAFCRGVISNWVGYTKTFCCDTALR